MRSAWGRKITSRWLPLLAPVLIRLIGMTLRIRVEDPDGVLNGKQERPYLVAFWHNRIFMMPYLFDQFMRRNHLAKVLISPSRDGQLITDIIRSFHLGTVRGSSSKNAVKAMKEMSRVLAGEGVNLAITPDGPRGPKYKVRPGIIYLAQEGAYKILPLTYRLSAKWELNSWDKFQIPKPFARCEFIIGTPYNVAAEEDVETAAQELAERLGRC